MTLKQRSNKVGLDFLPRFFTEDLLGRIKNFFDKVAVRLQRHHSRHARVWYAYAQASRLPSFHSMSMLPCLFDLYRLMD